MIRKLFFVFCLLLTACSLPGQSTAPAPQAWFDMPLPDTILYPPNPCQVIAHGASPNGISAFEISLNGTLATSVPASDSKQTLGTLKTVCPALAPGKNIIEVRAQDSTGSWSGWTQTIVYLADEPAPVRPTETAVPASPAAPTRMTTRVPPSTLTRVPVRTFTSVPSNAPTRAPSFTPTRVPSNTPTRVPSNTPIRVPSNTPTRVPSSTPTTVVSTGGVTVERISTNLVYLGRADCGPLDVTITARAVAPNGIRVVVLFYRFATSSSSSEFESVSMNSIGGDLYERTLNPTSLLGGVPFESATLQYQIVIQQVDGDTSLRTPVLGDISVQACGAVTRSCSAYTDERSCIANGCNWVSIPGTVPIFECRNP